MEKRCIFHIPNYLDVNRASASQIRPQKMKTAFEENGYLVDVVWGYGKERRKQLAKIKKNIKNGTMYDFLYSESSTMPTLLTEKHHLPIYPFLDFGFFKYIKRHGIKIGLFYRDMYWKFPEYKESVRGLKYKIAISMYQYDLRQYAKLLDKFYLPSRECYSYLKKEIPLDIVDVLPPGCSICDKIPKVEETTGKLTLLYVGGVGYHYQLDKVVKAIAEVPEVDLILCCRKEEWEREKENNKAYLRKKIYICHAAGEELERLYRKAQIGLAYFDTDLYMKMAMPFKVFEYIGHGLPVISNAGTVASDFVEKEKIGWVIQYDIETLCSLLKELSVNQDILSEKRESVYRAAERNTWQQRAKKVERELRL